MSFINHSIFIHPPRYYGIKMLHVLGRLNWLSKAFGRVIIMTEGLCTFVPPNKKCSITFPPPIFYINCRHQNIVNASLKALLIDKALNLAEQADTTAIVCRTPTIAARHHWYSVPHSHYSRKAPLLVCRTHTIAARHHYYSGRRIRPVSMLYTSVAWGPGISSEGGR